MVRSYYRRQNMTAPTYRLEYIYTSTSGANHMRNFLTTTAAYRCLCEKPVAPGVYISDSVQALLAKGGDFSNDFAASLVKLSRNGIVDVRKGFDCVFHDHADGKVCPRYLMEPYMDE